MKNRENGGKHPGKKTPCVISSFIFFLGKPVQTQSGVHTHLLQTEVTALRHPARLMYFSAVSGESVCE